MTERPIAWKRVGRGILLVGLGTFLLLTTLGFLSWSFWLEAIWYWPVLLVALGLRLILTREKTPWAVLVSPLIILGALTYVAVAGPRTWQREWVPVRASRPAEATRWTLDGSMALGRVNMRARPLPEDLLVEGKAIAHQSQPLSVNHRGESSRVRMGGLPTGWRVVGFPGWRQNWDLNLARDLPLTIALDSAFITGDIDLAETTVSRIDLDGAFNDLTFYLGAPQSDTRIGFKGAFNNLKLVVPDSTQVRYSTDGLLNIVDGRLGKERTGPAYRLWIDGAFNRMVIESD